MCIKHTKRKILESCAERKTIGAGETFFIFRSEIGSVTGGIRRHGRIYRFADAIFYRLGLCRSFSLGFRRREYPAVQFRGRAGDSGADGARPFALSVRCRFGEYARRYDLLLDRAFGQAGLDYPLPAGRAAKIDRVSRFLEGKGALFAFFTFLPYVGERRHRTRPDAQQCLDYGRCDVRRQIAPLRGDCGCFAGSAFVVLRLSAAGTCVRHGERHISCCVENR